MELKNWLNSINFTKEDLSEHIKSYSPFIINKCLSGHIDCIMYSNEMNMNSHLNNKMQYDFYINSIRKRNRFSPWVHKEKIKEIEYVQKYYGYSYEKAYQSLKILTRKQVEFIKKSFETGGTK